MGNDTFKRYYKCPRCKRQVWAWAMYEGNICWKCPGTILHGVHHTVPVWRDIVKNM